MTLDVYADLFDDDLDSVSASLNAARASFQGIAALPRLTRRRESNPLGAP